MLVQLQNLQVSFIYQGHRVKVKVKVTGAKTACLCILFVGDLPSIERQSCTDLISLLLYVVVHDITGARRYTIAPVVACRITCQRYLIVQFKRLLKTVWFV